MSYVKQTIGPIAQMRTSSNDRMISCSQLLVDLHIPKKTLSYNGWAMEQLTLLQNQFPVEEVKIDIMFKFKLCIYYICILRLHKKIYWLFYGYQFLRSIYWVLGDEQRLLILNSVSVIQQCWLKFLMLTEKRSRSSPYWRTFTHITYCFETLRKNINNYGLFVVKYYYVL